MTDDTYESGPYRLSVNRLQVGDLGQPMKRTTMMSRVGIVVLALNLLPASWSPSLGVADVEAREVSEEQPVFHDPSTTPDVGRPAVVRGSQVGVRAVFGVNSTADAVDAAPGNGTCADAAGQCTLRAAINEANALAGAHTINVPAGTYLLTIAGVNENAGVSDDLDILGSMTIVGAGADSTIVDAGNQFRVLDVRPGAVASLSHLTIQRGRGVGLQGAGILNLGTLSATNVKVLNNQSISAGTTQGNGAGVENAQGGVLAMTDSLVSGNRSTAAGNLGAFGGGIANFGIANASAPVTSQVTLTNTTVTNNTADSSGGGINMNQQGARTTVRGSTISGNAATSNGGAIALGGSGASTLSIESSTLSGNSATSLGGAIGAFLNTTGTSSVAITIDRTTIDGNAAGTSSGGIGFGGPNSTLTITNTTISNNRANGTNGGGMALGSTATGTSPGVVTVTNSTFSGNGAVGGGGGIASSLLLTLLNTTIANNTASTTGGGLSIRPGTATLQNTIVAGNAAPSGADCNGTAISQGGNLVSSGTCGLAGPGDLANISPQLGPLANNGGPTLTHLPQTGSPAIDAGSNAGCPSADQRGIGRPLDGNGDGSLTCDIGAVETLVLLPVVCTPRPPVGVNAVRTGDGRLRVTLTANGANNVITQVQITRNTNGTLAPASPPLGSAESQFFISRTTAGAPTTVALTITDRCGDWKTFVGGGATGF